MLARYNGSSHPHPNRIEQTRIEFAPHIHKTTERYLRANMKADGFAEQTNRYSTLAGAMHALVTDLNMRGLETKPDHPELSL
jgi:hypothetical protein